MTIEVLTGQGAFANGYRWKCKNLSTGEETNVDGPLAEILAQYPEYELTYQGHPESVGDKQVEYEIRHACGESFKPEKKARLSAEVSERKQFKHQDLLMGSCPRCKIPVFAWIGINHLGEAAKYFAIKTHNQLLWIDRMLEEQRRTVVKLDPAKHSMKRMGTVNGCIRERRSEKYQFKDVISVN